MVKKIAIKFLSTIIIPVAFLNSRLYMRLSCIVLKKKGIVFIGRPRYIHYSSYFDSFANITIGNRCVISSGCYFLTHDYSFTTAYIACNRSEPPTDIAFVKDIFIGENVFIGRGSLIMPGTKICDNVIIGSMSVVRGEIKSGSIVIGNPMTVIGNIEDKYSKWVKLFESNPQFMHIDKK
jgi:maltose O-acetyltransferase